MKKWLLLTNFIFVIILCMIAYGIYADTENKLYKNIITYGFNICIFNYFLIFIIHLIKLFKSYKDSI